MAKTNKNANYVTNKTQVAKENQAKAKNSQKTKALVKQILIITGIVLVVAGLITGIVFAFIGCTRTEPRQFKAPVAGAFEVTDVVELEFEGYGTVKIELYGKEAPKTVANFLELVKDGRFNENSISFTSTTDKKMTISLDHDHSEENHSDAIKGEFYDNGFANKISHITGVLTMSKYSEYASSANNFMIMLNDHAGETNETNETTNATTKYGYDGHYAAFGKVTDGSLTVIEKMMADYKETASSSSSSTATPEDELVFGSNKITLDKTDIEKDIVEYKFTPSVTGKYTFMSSTLTSILISKAGDSAADGAKSLLGVEQTKDALKDGVEYELEKGVEYKVVLGIKDLAVGTKLLTISGDILFVGTNKVEFTEEEANSGNVTYEFTPDKTGVYFFVGKDDIKDKIEIFDGENSVGTKSAYLEADKKYSIIITTKEEDKVIVEAETAYELTITAPTLATGENKLEIPEYDVLKEGKAVYYFTPSADGKYLISNKDLTITVYNAEGVKLEGDYIELKKDETYKVEISADLSSKLFEGTNTITITKASEESAKCESEYKFVAENSGKYTFTAPSGVEVEVYSGTAKQEAKDGMYELIAGKTYTIKLISPVEVKDQALEIAISVKDEGAERVINYVTYTLNVQDTALAVGTNTQTITKAEVDNKTAEFTFTATTNGPISFTGTFPFLDENGEQLKNEAGQLRYKNAIITIKDKDGNVFEDAKYAKLVKGETYTVVLKSDNIGPNSACTIKIAKVLPKLTGAKVVEG